MRAQVSDMVALDDRIIVGLTVTRSSAAESGAGEFERWQVFTVSGNRIVDIVGFDTREEAIARADRSALPD